MNPEFVWTTPFPKRTPKEQVEDTAWAVIKVQPDPRGLASTVRNIHLGSTLMELGFQGVAYNEKDEPVYAFTYKGGVSRACYFDDPNKTQLLGLGAQ